MERAPPRDPQRFVGYALVRVAHVLQRRMDEALQPVGINARQFSVLVYLAQTPNITAGRLSRLVLVTPQSMSELLSTLVTAGLVEREAPAGRGHPMGASITRAGRAVLGKAFGLVEALEQETVSSLTNREASRLNEQLLAMLERLGG